MPFNNAFQSKSIPLDPTRSNSIQLHPTPSNSIQLHPTPSRLSVCLPATDTFFARYQASQKLTPQQTWDNRNSIYLGSAAAAEFIADIFLCPLESTRIRLVSNPTYADSMIGCMSKMAAEEGMIGAFYSGFAPILAKQIPYTMTKFAVQGIAAEKVRPDGAFTKSRPPCLLIRD